MPDRRRRAASQWLQKAAATGNTGAMTNLGAQLAGLDPPDLPAARVCWETAAAVSHTGATADLGVLLATDWDPPDLRAARAWLERAASAGDTGAMNNLGGVLARSDPPDLEQRTLSNPEAEVADAVAHCDH